MKILIPVLCVLAAVIALLLLLFLYAIIVSYHVPKNLRHIQKNHGKLFAGEHALIGAHRAGAGIAPENTPMAIDLCLKQQEFKVDELEFDLHMTKDGKLIVLHDPSLDRTTDAVERFGRTDNKPGDLTYEEIASLNPGEHFMTDDGRTPYRGLRGDSIPEGLRIPLMEEVIDQIEACGEYLYSIDIKDSGETGRKAADALIKLINEKGIQDRVIVATFNSDITRYLTEHYPQTQRSIGVLEGILFYFACAFNIKKDPSRLPFKAVQIPANQFKIIRGGTERLIRYCHNLGIAVQYWTIDDPKEIRRLSDIGADCIITDVPDQMYKLFSK